MTVRRTTTLALVSPPPRVKTAPYQPASSLRDCTFNKRMASSEPDHESAPEQLFRVVFCQVRCCVSACERRLTLVLGGVTGFTCCELAAGRMGGSPDPTAHAPQTIHGRGGGKRPSESPRATATRCLHYHLVWQFVSFCQATDCRAGVHALRAGCCGFESHWSDASRAVAQWRERRYALVHFLVGRLSSAFDLQAYGIGLGGRSWGDVRQWLTEQSVANRFQEWQEYGGECFARGRMDQVSDAGEIDRAAIWNRLLEQGRVLFRQHSACSRVSA